MTNFKPSHAFGHRVGSPLSHRLGPVCSTLYPSHYSLLDPGCIWINLVLLLWTSSGVTGRAVRAFACEPVRKMVESVHTNGSEGLRRGLMQFHSGLLEIPARSGRIVPPALRIVIGCGGVWMPLPTGLGRSPCLTQIFYRLPCRNIVQAQRDSFLSFSFPRIPIIESQSQQILCTITSTYFQLILHRIFT